MANSIENYYLNLGGERVKIQHWMKFLPLKPTDLTVKILKQVQRNLLFHSITKQLFPFFLLSHIIITKDCICFIFKRWQIPSWTWRQAICSVRTAGYTNTAWRFLLSFRKILINTQTLLFAPLHFHLSLRREFVSRLKTWSEISIKDSLSWKIISKRKDLSKVYDNLSAKSYKWSLDKFCTIRSLQ